MNTFPSGGTPRQPTVVEVIGGSIIIPNHVNLQNLVLIARDGNIVFRGRNHTLTNVTLISHRGKVGLGHVNATNLSVFSSKRIRAHKGAILGGNSLLSSGAAIIFKGMTRNQTDKLTLVSQSDIAFRSKTLTRAQLFAGDDIVLLKGTRLRGRAQAKGDITIQGNVELMGGELIGVWGSLGLVDPIINDSAYRRG
ncbi:MAG: hypothetical protein F6K09_38290 [Merismopedia sp. SIO2A8]|nr:hypothetical protein [Merismopedia sp. SIO2A8]